jgi:anti-sigma factor RsiW
MEHLTCDQAEILLNLHLDGLLDGADAARLDAHLAVCPACQSTLAELEALNTALAALPDAPVPPAVLSGVLARIPPAPAPAPANGFTRWRWLLGGSLALEAVAAILLLLLNWPLASAFVRGLMPTAAIDAAGHHLADGINAWLAWFNVQGALAQAQWQVLADQVSSLALAVPAPELVAQAIILLAVVLVVWVAGNRVLAVAVSSQ